MATRRTRRCRAATMVLGALALLPPPLPLVGAAPTVELSAGRTLARPGLAGGLKGRFLHITDLHPDPHYLWKAKLDEGCHRKAKGKRKKDEDVAGYWGTPVSDCDSPSVLINTTFKWLREHWSSEVDFVVWTGDSARHDLDPKLPRTLDEILALNEDLAVRMRDSFAKGVPIVPSVGNNDVYPHNVMAGGPSKLTDRLAKVWKHFIPEEDFHVFQGGAYFSKTVIPHRLAVVSLNTMYFYHSNALVDGCPPFDSLASDDIDPGTEELDWLEVQLQRHRAEGMQVYLTGHVPPSDANWYRRCWERYGQLSLAYQDTVVGHLYGHMNEDHFSLIDAHDVFTSSSSSAETTPDRRRGVRTAESLDDRLLSSFRDLPKRRKTDMADFAVVNVGPSVVPTYNPSARIYIYNNTPPSSSSLLDRIRTQVPLSFDSFLLTSKKGKGKRPGRHASPHSPIRSNRFLTPLGYTQFFVDLARSNKHAGYGPGKEGKERKGKGEERPDLEWEVEYTTATREKLVEASVGEGKEPLLFPKEMAPKDLRNLTGSEATRLLIEMADRREENEDEDEDGDAEVEGVWAAKKDKVAKLTPWELDHLTVDSWLELARKLAKGKKAWKRFRKYMVVST